MNSAEHELKRLTLNSTVTNSTNLKHIVPNWTVTNGSCESFKYALEKLALQAFWNLEAIPQW